MRPFAVTNWKQCFERADLGQTGEPYSVIYDEVFDRFNGCAS